MKDARGHGSNAKGVHNTGINNIGNVSLHPNVFTAVKQNPNGFSVKPRTGQMPTSGYMVSIPGHTHIVMNADPALVAKYANAHADVLQDPKAHIGGWTDPNTGKTYLDVSHRYSNKGAAIKAGQAHNQIAIWDVKHGREIRTGGTGK